MAAVNVTAIDAVLRELYPQKRVRRIGYDGHPFMALVPKYTKFGGKKLVKPVIYGTGQGASRTFATAKANKSASKTKAFEILRRKDYALHSIELEAIYAAEDDMGAFLRSTQMEMDGTVRTASDNLAQSLWGNFGGARAQVGSVSTTSLTLKNIRDVHKFSIGMKIQSAATDGTSGAVTADATEIVGIDRVNGVLVAAANWAGTFGADDYLFREDDFGLSIDGVGAWVPESVSPSDNFNTVNRSEDTRLAGYFLDGTSLAKVEAMQDLDTLLVDAGAKPSHWFVNPFDFNAIRKELGADVVWDRAVSPDMATIGFKTIGLNSTCGKTVHLVADRCVPYGVGFCLQMDSWTLNSLGSSPRILSAQGLNGYVYDSDADSVELRMGMYGNLDCNAPGFNGRVKFHEGV